MQFILIIDHQINDHFRQIMLTIFIKYMVAPAKSTHRLLVTNSQDYQHQMQRFQFHLPQFEGKTSIQIQQVCDHCVLPETMTTSWWEYPHRQQAEKVRFEIFSLSIKVFLSQLTCSSLLTCLRVLIIFGGTAQLK